MPEGDAVILRGALTLGVGASALCACSLAGSAAPTGSHEGCEARLTPAARDACHAELVLQRFERDPAAALEDLQLYLPGPLARDFVFLQATLAGGGAQDYCPRIEDPDLAERCASYMSRPHLYSTNQIFPANKEPPAEGAAEAAN